MSGAGERVGAGWGGGYLSRSAVAFLSQSDMAHALVIRICLHPDRAAFKVLGHSCSHGSLPAPLTLKSLRSVMS